MQAMVLNAPGKSLRLTDLPRPRPASGQVLIRVMACAVCRTDLHVVDGDLCEPKLPVVPGHEIVGSVEELGEGVHRLKVGDRVGVPWLGWTCGVCEFCRSDRENLCDAAKFTGYTVDGGYAEYTVADERFCLGLPKGMTEEAAAPLLCAGLIGYRCLMKAGEGRRIGIYGFGAAAHLVVQVARHQERRVFAFVRPGDKTGEECAFEQGAEWAGPSTSLPPEPLDAAIIFAPVGALVPLALRSVAKGGIVVCGGIHMSDIPRFPYVDLWHERSICSVANLTRRDGEEFMKLAGEIPVRTRTETFALAEADEALARLRSGRLRGVAVLKP